MKVKKFGQKPVNFIFSDEKCTLYKINNLNCTEDEFMDWLQTFDYDELETTYGIHDYSGGVTDDDIQVGFSSYEISETDFPIVMEIWRKGLLDAGFISEDQKVEIEKDENCEEDDEYEDGMINDEDETSDNLGFSNHYGYPGKHYHN